MGRASENPEVERVGRCLDERGQSGEEQTEEWRRMRVL